MPLLRRNMFQIIIPFFISIFFLFFIEKAQSAEIVDRIVAIVNDDIVTLSELNLSLKPYTRRILSFGYSLEREKGMLYKVREELLQNLIDQQLTDQEIKRYQIKFNEKEIDDTIERIKEANLYTDEALREVLAKDGLSMEEYRASMKSQILRSRLVDYEVNSKVIITKEDIRSYYEKHGENYRGSIKYHLRNIIVPVSQFAGQEEKFKILDNMKAVLERLKAGEPFETMARNYSQSSLADEGGDLGLFNLEELSPQIREAIKDLKPGEFTDILDTDKGYQIILLQEIADTPAISMEEVYDEIEGKLYDEKIDKKLREWLENLRGKAHIKIIK